MLENPYKFYGPLDPIEDEIVCISRSKEINKVITGIRRGAYWTILGPRQIGKTTLLYQIKHELTSCYCIYIDFEVSPKTDEAFYEWIMNIILENITAKPLQGITKKWKNFGAELNFYYFLKTLQTKEDKTIVLFFDEIEKASSLRSFLHIWRKVFHERNEYPELNKYSVIIAGGVDLISLTIGPTSPFNIALKLQLSDFSEQESEKLINEPLQKLNIKIEPEAKQKLIHEVSGHPQLLQHLCYILVEQAVKKKKHIAVQDVDNAIEWLMLENTNIKSLEKEIKTNKILEDLIKRIIKGDKIEYLPYQELSTTGTGIIARDDNYCIIRNNIYKKFLTKIIAVDDNEPEGSEKSEYVTIIYVNIIPQEFTSLQQEKDFLRGLFSSDIIEFEILKNEKKLDHIDLDRKEKLIFCYLAYKNYKAIKKGFSDWRKIPLSYEYRLSSNPENNKNHIPEWDMLIEALGREPFGDDIRSWIFSLRNQLKPIGAENIIHTVSGRGRGYLLKGTVEFAVKE